MPVVTVTGTSASIVSLLNRIVFVGSFVFSLVSTCQATLPEGVADLLHREDVQAELKLTEDQKRLWQRMDSRPKLKQTAAFEADAVVLEDPDSVLKRESVREEKAWSLLQPGQVARLLELFAQRQKQLVVLRPDFQTRLNLSSEQIAEVRVAHARYKMRVRDLATKVRAAKTEIARPDPKKVQNALEQAELKLRDELDLLLTDAQRTELETLYGKKFVFLERKFG